MKRLLGWLFFHTPLPEILLLVLSWAAVSIAGTPRQQAKEFSILPSETSRDMVFTPVKLPRTDQWLKDVKVIYFNGDWHGVRLCRGVQCVEYDEIFR